MISSPTEYEKAREELQYLNQWLSRLENEIPRKGLTTASVRKMISRLQEELAEYEASGDAVLPTSQEPTEPKEGGTGQNA